MNKKFYFTSLCLIIRDENKYLKEWLLHHLPLTDHIYIYDNGEKENVSDIISLLSKPDQSKITIISYKDGYQHIQEEAYNHFLENYGQETIWCAFIDSDEFICIDCDKTIRKILTEKDSYNEIQKFCIEYGANGMAHYDDRPVQERFQTPAEGKNIRMYKSFIKTDKITRMLSHFPVYDQKNNFCYKDDRMELFHINHYYTKSFEEWKEKMYRGSSNPHCLKKFNEFFDYNPDMKYLKDKEKNFHNQTYNAGYH